MHYTDTGEDVVENATEQATGKILESFVISDHHCFLSCQIINNGLSTFPPPLDSPFCFPNILYAN